MPTGQRREFGTLLLASLSAASLTAARCESIESLVWLLGTSTLFIAVPWILWISLQTRLGGQLNGGLPLICAAWTVSPLGSEFLLRRIGIGDAPEITMLVCFQNAGLVAAAFSHRPRCQTIACQCAAFLALFAIVIGTSPAAYALAGVFGVLMLWWLMARYWERIQQTVIARQTDRCLPLRSSVLAGAALLTALILVALGSTPSTYVLRGFIPSSGGDRWTSEFARAGIGDGDDMVAATDEAMSFGPVESDLFLDSDMPTLYDMFNDMYGEPPKPRAKQERSIGLASGDVDEKENKQRIAKTERSGREFSILRRRTKTNQGSLEDRSAARDAVRCWPNSPAFGAGTVRHIRWPPMDAVKGGPNEPADPSGGTQWKTLGILHANRCVINSSRYRATCVEGHQSEDKPVPFAAAANGYPC